MNIVLFLYKKVCVPQFMRYKIKKQYDSGTSVPLELFGPICVYAVSP